MPPEQASNKQASQHARCLPPVFGAGCSKTQPKLRSPPHNQPKPCHNTPRIFFVFVFRGKPHPAVPHVRRDHRHVGRDVHDVRAHGPPGGLPRHGQPLRDDLHGTREARVAASPRLLDPAVSGRFLGFPPEGRWRPNGWLRGHSFWSVVRFFRTCGWAVAIFLVTVVQTSLPLMARRTPPCSNIINPLCGSGRPFSSAMESTLRWGVLILLRRPTVVSDTALNPTRVDEEQEKRPRDFCCS